MTADGSAVQVARVGLPLSRGDITCMFPMPVRGPALIFRHFEGACGARLVSVVHPLMLDESGLAETDFDGATGDDVLQTASSFRSIFKAIQNRPGALRFPVLWDRQSETIVSNEIF